jgi:hypothetical protein
MKYFPLVFLFIISTIQIKGQNYHGVQGSSFAGSLGVSNNPSAIVNTLYPWDVTLFAIQLKSATNAYTINDYSLLSSTKNTNTQANSGNYARFADLNFNINLLNTRIALNPRRVIAFGLNVRGYGSLKTGPYQFIDTLHNITQFLNLNPDNSVYHADFSHSSWLEAFATYGQTIWDDNLQRFNAGITLKAMRGISGAFVQLQNGAFPFTPNGTRPMYTLKSLSARYGYSYNYDEWQNTKSTSQNIMDFVNNTRGGVSVDLGFEYLIKPQGVKTYFDDEDYYDYDWKIGVSVLDLGHNQYRYGNQSRSFTGPAVSITDSILDPKFTSVSSLSKLNDSIASVVLGFSQTAGKFKVQNPTRLVVNMDRNLGNDFYMNAELSINLGKSLSGSDALYSRELTLLTCTPRWETKRWGVYLPVLYNGDREFWVGGAFKAGPLIVGFHNWANVFSKNKMQNGGGYIAVVIHPGGTTKPKTDKRLECPKQ